MFGFFSTTCPIPPADKAWIELRMQWLAAALGPDRLLRAPVIVPTSEHFPDRYDQGDEDIRRLFRQVCGYLDIPPRRITLELFDGHRQGDPAGTYEQGPPERIVINRAELEHPMSLVGTLAHELCHALLLGDGRLSADMEDMEALTDLATVFMGLGVFSANSVFREQHARDAQWYYWSMAKKGYLSETTYAHALALLAWARGERKPTWGKHLRLNVSEPFWESLKYLFKTGDSLFQLDSGTATAQPVTAPPVAWEALDAELRKGTPGRQIAAIWRLRARMTTLPRVPGASGEAVPPALIDALCQALDRGDTSVRMEAATALGLIGSPAAKAVPRLLDPLVETSHETLILRYAALEALGSIGGLSDPQIDELALCLDLQRDGHDGAAAALARLGPAAAVALPRVRRVLDDWDPFHRDQILEALAAMGAAAVVTLPRLCEWLEDHDDPSGPALATTIGRVAGAASASRVAFDLPTVLEVLSGAIASEDIHLQAAAAEALGRLGREALPAAPALEKLASRPGEAQLSADLALARIKDRVLPLIGLLRDEAPRLGARSDRSPAWPSDPRWAPAFADLGHDLTAELRPLATHSNPQERWFAVWTLAHLGSAAESAAPRLATLANDPEPRIRVAAAFALWNATRKLEPLLDVFRQACSPACAAFAPPIETALCEVGAPAVSGLLALLEDPVAAAEAESLLARLAVINPEAARLVEDWLPRAPLILREAAVRISRERIAEEARLQAHAFQCASWPPRLPPAHPATSICLALSELLATPATVSERCVVR